jgi:hypothetical protein
MRRLPTDVVKIVDKHTRQIISKVDKACNELVLRPNQEESLPHFLAWSLFHQHLLNRVFPTKLAGKDRFRELSYIHSMRTGLDLLGTKQATRILRAVDIIELGLIGGHNALGYADGDLREETKRELCNLDTAFEEDLNVSSIEAHLKHIANHAKSILGPLFDGDKNVEYFTCVELIDQFPWKPTQE